MEVIIGAVIIILLLALLGVDIWYILLGIIALMDLAALFTAVMFAVCVVWLLRSRRRVGEFLRFDEGKRFEYAVYWIEGEDYGNIFPAEMILRERLYKTETPVTLRLSGSRVFDRNAFLTIVIGFPVSLIIFLAFAWVLLLLLGLI